MRIPVLVPILLGLLAAVPAAAQGVMGYVRSDRWAQAEAAVADHPDPVARKLVLWMRLLAPGAARAGEIGGFIAENPDWPQQALLARRRDEALALEPDQGVVAAECARSVPEAAPALMRCAEVVGGRDGTALLRAAWVAGPADPAWEARFLARYPTLLSREDQQRRFERLGWTDLPGARRQAERVDAAAQRLADVRLALRRDDPDAGTLAEALPAAQRGDPALLLDLVRWHRRALREDTAAALLKARGTAAERAAPAERRPAFWEERNLLARRRLRAGDNAGAYALAAGHAQTGGEQLLDAEFLAGFIALRRLQDQATATRHFQALVGTSKAAITQGRAQDRLGRAAGDPAAARGEFSRAAAWPSTYYGQLAAVALGDDPQALAARVAATRDPQADAAQALALSGREMARAAALLVAWGEPRRAQAFLLRLDDIAPDPADRGLAARLATGFGMPGTAVSIARRAGRDGLMLVETGWPTPIDPPSEAGVEPALTLAITRQESNFDTAAVSPAGARGLMQLMPGTAAEVARNLGIAAPLPALTADPTLNMRLGTTYLRGLMDRFDANVAFAAAGYNAGPGRVTEWIAANGDPRNGGADMIDWIELIPFNETRNYVQRVVENLVVYRARRGEALAHPLAPWLR